MVIRPTMRGFYRTGETFVGSVSPFVQTLLSCLNKNLQSCP
jgi:hypothetical protein